MHNGVRYDCLSQDWYRYLASHTLSFIPNRPDLDFHSISHKSDVLIFTGGDRDPVRDLVEDRLFAAASKICKPIIGICHGFQRLTELMGGTIEPIDGHANTGHDVFDTQGKRHWVNSHHRFRVRDLPIGTTVAATDSHGNCESWVCGNMGGVMWHPERGPFDWVPDELSRILFLEKMDGV